MQPNGSAGVRRAAIVLVAMILGIVVLWACPLSYFYCLAFESSWLAARTEAELEQRIHAFYRKHTIAPSQSMWGHQYSLRPGERMIQYLIFGKEPLDVVFDSEARVVTIFTSYE